MREFKVSVDGGPEQTIDVAVSQYRLAVAAIPGLLGCNNLPMRVKIWSAKLVPEYGPYHYLIDEDRHGNVVVKHDVGAYGQGAPTPKP